MLDSLAVGGASVLAGKEKRCRTENKDLHWRLEGPQLPVGGPKLMYSILASDCTF